MFFLSDTTTPLVSTGSWVTVLVALLAALPGMVGGAYAYRKRKDTNATEFGTEMAKTAFQNLVLQVDRLTDEQAKWAQDREDWDVDRTMFVSKINTLTDQLRVTNTYLQTILSLLDVNEIPRPKPPGVWDFPMGGF